MGLNAATLEILVSKGLSAADILEVARALELRSDPTAVERKRRQRENAASERDMSQRDVTRDTPSLDKVSPQTPLQTNPIPTPPFNPPAPRTSKGTRLADDFEVPDDWIDWAMKKRGWGRAETVDEAECFVRFWQAKPGKDACKLDWPKTWQNWTVNSRRQPLESAGGAWNGMA